MNRDKLFEMLDLGGLMPAQAVDGDADLTIADAALAPSRAPLMSETALALDEFELRRGHDAVEEAGLTELTGLVRKDLETSLDEKAKVAADLHAAAYELDPQLNDGCVDDLRHQFIKQMMDTPEYQALRTHTCLNQLASMIAVGHFATQLAGLRMKRDEQAKDRKPGGGKNDDSGGDLESEIEVMGRVAQAVSDAAQDIREFEEAAAAMGLGPGSPGCNDTAAIAAIYRRIRQNPKLRRICELAGAFRRMAQARQRQRATHGYDDMVGVELDGDVGRLLPHEMAALADPDLEDDACRRLIERQTMCRQYRGVEPVGKGPIIVTVDESGSMHGEKGYTAKALALALAWIARHQKRWIALIAFSGGKEGRPIVLRPGRWDEVTLMDWLDKFLGGGTTLDVPVDQMPDYYAALGAPKGKTDLICITDAEVIVPADMAERFNRWKAQAKARMTTLVVEGQPGNIKCVSDEVYQLPAITTEQAAVQRVLSI